MTILGKLRHPWVQTRPVACTPSTHCTPCKVDSAHHAKCTEHTMHSAHYAQSAQKKFAQHCVNMHPSLRYIEVFKISQSAGFGNGLFTRIYEQLVHTFNFYLFLNVWHWCDDKLWGESLKVCPALAVQTSDPYASHCDNIYMYHDMHTTVNVMWKWSLCEKYPLLNSTLGNTLVCNTCFTLNMKLPESPTACIFIQFWIVNYTISQLHKRPKSKSSTIPIPLYLTSL